MNITKAITVNLLIRTCEVTELISAFRDHSMSFDLTPIGEITKILIKNIRPDEVSKYLLFTYQIDDNAEISITQFH